MEYKYERKTVRTVDGYIKALKNGYIHIDYPNEIRRSLLATLLNKSKDSIEFEYQYVVVLFDDKEKRSKAKKKKCFELTQKLANKELVRAINGLAYFYYYGYGVEKDLRKAVLYYKVAAEAGLATAQYNLYYCYDNIPSLYEKKEEALTWLDKSAKQGYLRALYIIGSTFKGFYSTEERIECLYKAIKQNYYYAYSDLARRLITVNKNEEAMKYAKLALKHNLDSYEFFGDLFQRNDDNDRALYFYTRGIRRGEICCYRGMAMYYEDIDKEKAIRLYKKSLKGFDKNSLQYQLIVMSIEDLKGEKK